MRLRSPRRASEHGVEPDERDVMNPVFARALVLALFGALVLMPGCGGEPEVPQQRFVKLNVKTVDVGMRGDDQNVEFFFHWGTLRFDKTSHDCRGQSGLDAILGI